MRWSWPGDAQGFRIGGEVGQLANRTQGYRIDEGGGGGGEWLNSQPIVRRAIRLKVHIRMLAHSLGRLYSIHQDCLYCLLPFHSQARASRAKLRGQSRPIHDNDLIARRRMTRREHWHSAVTSYSNDSTGIGRCSPEEEG